MSKHQYVLNAKKNFRVIFLACARRVQLRLVKSVINLAVALLNMTSHFAKCAAARKEEKLDESIKIQSAWIACPAVDYYQKYRRGKMIQSFQSTMKNFKKDPTKPVMICGHCAKRKCLVKAERIWIRDGRCGFCLDRTYVCQIIEYMAADATVYH